MSTRLLDRAGKAIAERTSRRSFITKSALVGSALVTAPTAYVLRPGTAYAAICRCNNQDCDCGSSCCDGYTEFCCTMTGVNSCPTDTVPAGWWKVDGSSFCTANGTPGPRYYLDCNATASGPCGPAGVTRATDMCDCSCSGGDCSNRKACCTAFRYGQCNQQIACLGPIVCRVVTCTPPWRFDPSCTTATATDNGTRFHDAPCLANDPTVTQEGLGQCVCPERHGDEVEEPVAAEEETVPEQAEAPGEETAPEQEQSEEVVDVDVDEVDPGLLGR